jgi:hypothetical protein
LSLSSLDKLAAYTGGRSYINTDIGKALHWTSEATNNVYLLGYRPQNLTFDGSFRKIEVKVNRKGAKVYSRQGYYASARLEAYDQEYFRMYSRTVKAAEYGDPITDIAFSLSSDEYRTTKNETRFTITFILAPRQEVFTEQDGLWRGKFALTSLVYSNEGRLAYEDWSTLDLKFNESDFQTVQEDGFIMDRAFEVPVKLKRPIFQMVVYSYDHDLVGSQSLRLE